jgi:hypothetical protein
MLSIWPWFQPKVHVSLFYTTFSVSRVSQMIEALPSQYHSINIFTCEMKGWMRLILRFVKSLTYCESVTLRFWLDHSSCFKD